MTATEIAKDINDCGWTCPFCDSQLTIEVLPGSISIHHNLLDEKGFSTQSDCEETSNKIKMAIADFVQNQTHDIRYLQEELCNITWKKEWDDYFKSLRDSI